MTATNESVFLVDFLPVSRRTSTRSGFVINVRYFTDALKPWIARRQELGRFVIRRDPRHLSRICPGTPQRLVGSVPRQGPSISTSPSARLRALGTPREFPDAAAGSWAGTGGTRSWLPCPSRLIAVAVCEAQTVMIESAPASVMP